GDGTTATVEGRNTYDPYGKAVSLPSWQGAPVPVSYGFTGARREESTGLYLMHHRWYEPATGRFIEQDPIGESGGLNVNAYVGASPTMWVDPTGLRGARYDPMGGLLGSGQSRGRSWSVDGISVSSSMADFVMRGIQAMNDARAWRISVQARPPGGDVLISQAEADEEAAKGEDDETPKEESEGAEEGGGDAVSRERATGIQKYYPEVPMPSASEKGSSGRVHLVNYAGVEGETLRIAAARLQDLVDELGFRVVTHDNMSPRVTSRSDHVIGFVTVDQTFLDSERIGERYLGATPPAGEALHGLYSEVYVRRIENTVSAFLGSEMHRQLEGVYERFGYSDTPYATALGNMAGHELGNQLGLPYDKRTAVWLSPPAPTLRVESFGPGTLISNNPPLW
ncbi:MAG: RHS repeat-associated core domain-containing protein, partial [Acidobacteriota bacterium]|nr:RHS repeat-associated core domain-containing protein [Acidobacteriota bacterium]